MASGCLKRHALIMRMTRTCRDTCTTTRRIQPLWNSPFASSGVALRIPSAEFVHTSTRLSIRPSTSMDIGPTSGLDIHIDMSASRASPPPAPALPPRPQKLINLMRGWPSPDVLPVDLLKSATARVLGDSTISTPALQYGPDPGYGPLREGLARWLGRHFDVTPDPKRICITGGASQSVACLMQSYTDPAYTRAVWLVAPCYHLVCPVFEDAGFKDRLRATPEDEEGIDLPALEAGIKVMDDEESRRPQLKPFKGTRPFRKSYRHVIYVVTTSSNPSGKTMSLRRRKGLVELARKYDALVISDDVYDFLQWRLPGQDEDKPPEVVPRLCDIDRSLDRAPTDPEGFGHAISNGSFSKIVGPGVRTGWVEASPAFVHGLSMTGSSRSGGAPSQFCAAALSQLVASGELEQHVRETVVPGLRRRHALVMDAVREHVLKPGTGVAAARESGLLDGNTYGGYFVWMTLEPGVSAAAIARAAMAEENLIVGAGGIFEVAGDEERARFDSNIRLCFAWEPEEALVEGTKRLGRLLKRMSENRAYYDAVGQNTLDQGFVNANK